jgi:diguanylate cyclase (GGDEF)-like protein/PAS domain S-box-containing protein
MTPDAEPEPEPHPPRRISWRRLHAGLMPDYNKKATAYWWTMAGLGAFAFVFSLTGLAAMPGAALAQVAVGVFLAMVMALVPLKIPRTNQSFATGDVFIVLLLLMHGPAAGCVAAALEGLVSSWRSSKRWTTRLGTASIAAFSLFVCGPALSALSERLGSSGADAAAALVLAAMVFGLMYAACNAVLMSGVALLKRNRRLSLAAIASVFGWVGAASAVASALAALLFITQRLAGIGVMLTVLPIIGLLLTTLHYFSRQQEAEEATRNALARAVEQGAELAIVQSRQREAEQAAQHLRDLDTSERRFQSAFTHASIGMALVSREGRIYQGNPALRKLLGCDESAFGEPNFFDHVAREDQPRLAAALSGSSAGEIAESPIEIRCQRLDGTEVWASISCSRFAEPQGEGPGVIMQIQDVTARHRAELELQHRATHDKLTGLANRDRFHDALKHSIDLARRDPTQAFAVLFLDFDRFKLVNDSKGHTVGDEFLVKASKRLERCLRKGDMLARLGGDEFAVLATGLGNDTEAIDLAERLLAVLHEPLRLSTMEIITTASIGITFSSIGYTRPEDVLRDADIAMYRAKSDGKARYALFDVKHHTDIADRVRLEGDLRQALAQQAMTIAYQPLYDLASGALLGFEALSRWSHSQLGPISPGTFIPIAEESGLITQLTGFVLQDACRQLRQWITEHPGSDHLCVHVNVAARDLASVDFVPSVARALATSGLRPGQLVVELTENILMAQLAAAMNTLAALKQLGVGLSVDDFGTGYSSLSHLAVLPIDSLKIDMSFVRNLRAGSSEEAVIRAILMLARSLGKKVVAEGIETQTQLDLLRSLGCDYGQGFFLSRPLLPDGVASLLIARAAERVGNFAPSAPLSVVAGARELGPESGDAPLH